MARTQKSESVAEVVGRNLLRLRSAAGLTQDELAEKSGVHRITIAQIEGARYESTSFTTLQKLAKALGESIDEFFLESTAPAPASPHR